VTPLNFRVTPEDLRQAGWSEECGQAYDLVRRRALAALLGLSPVLALTTSATARP
jgi:hypothetical protein